MTPILMKRHMGALRPVDRQAEEAIAKIKHDQVVRVEWKTMRNPRQHRLYWAAIGLCFQNQREPSPYATQGELHAAIKVALGYCNWIEGKSGRIAIPKSIAFGNMGQDRWSEFFDKFVKLCCERIIPGTDNAEFRAELEAMVGS